VAAEPHIVSMGDCVTSGSYCLHSRFDHAINFCDGRGIISFVTEKIGSGPNNIVFGTKAPIQWFRNTEVEIRAYSLHVGDVVIPTSGIPRFNSAVDVPNLAMPKDGLKIFEQFLMDRAPARSLCCIFGATKETAFKTRFELAVIEAFKEAMENLTSGQIRNCIQKVQGLGWGLTPSGDDFIAGLLLGAHAFSKKSVSEIAAAIDFSKLTKLSAMFLRSAEMGNFSEPWLNLVSAIFSEDSERINTATQRILEIGASSGADMAVGIVASAKMMK